MTRPAEPSGRSYRLWDTVGSAVRAYLVFWSVFCAALLGWMWLVQDDPTWFNLTMSVVLVVVMAGVWFSALKRRSPSPR